MLRLTDENGIYLINHISLYTGKQVIVSLISAKLPLRAHLHMKSIFDRRVEIDLYPTDTQDQSITEVLSKLASDTSTDYVFIEQLRLTHTIELIHLITKIHLSRFQTIV